MRQAIIVDDERLARRRLRRLLERTGDVRVSKECGNGPEAVRALRESPPADVVFLDVQMPVLDGFEVIEAVGRRAMPPIVFVTAYEEHAIRAFEANALDYLVKPIEADRLARTLRRLERHPLRNEAFWQRLSSLLRRDHRRVPTRLSVRDGDRILIISADEVDFIRAEGNYVRLHAGDRSYLMRETMQRLEARLEGFLRVHRSTIVRADCIRELRPLRGGEMELRLTGGDRLTVSRRYRSRLARLFS